MAFEEGVGLAQMSPVKDATLRIAEESLAEFLPDPVVRRMAENTGDGQQDKNGSQSQGAVASRQSTDREQQRISREKWSHHQPGLAKDDQKEQCVDPGAVASRELTDIQVEMENDVQ